MSSTVSKQTRITTRQLTMTALFVALIAVGAFIRVPLPNCPFTLQILFTTLAGIVLGSRLGAASVGIYIVLGLVGVPIFTSGGGPSYFATYLWLFNWLYGWCVCSRTHCRDNGYTIVQTFASRIHIKSIYCIWSWHGVPILYYESVFR